MAALLLAVIYLVFVSLGKKVKKTQGGDPLRLFLYYS